MLAVPISFEFFPPKTAEGAARLAAARAELYALKPVFCSVTYGAGGSTQAGTPGSTERTGAATPTSEIADRTKAGV